MKDPYSILGVSLNSTDEEIKAAYRELAKKYHPDQYQQSPLADLAAEKMKEINEAYDMIMNQRKTSEHYSRYSNNSQNYSQVRNLIYSGNLYEASRILDDIPLSLRNAEWFFLKATVQIRMGFLEDAYRNATTACNMDPSNSEYRALLNQMNQQRTNPYASYRGYNSNPHQGEDCNSCDLCTGLICTDCCCECMGSDFIRCC